MSWVVLALYISIYILEMAIQVPQTSFWDSDWDCTKFIN